MSRIPDDTAAALAMWSSSGLYFSSGNIPCHPPVEHRVQSCLVVSDGSPSGKQKPIRSTVLQRLHAKIVSMSPSYLEAHAVGVSIDSDGVVGNSRMLSANNFIGGLGEIPEHPMDRFDASHEMKRFQLIR